ncbi:MAG: immunity 22 family protein [Saprospiraceae bacterium]
MSKIKAQFWGGKFINENVFKDFFEERYTEDDNESISKFAESQNETWIDHDFLEIGFEITGKNIKEKFIDYSYAEKWINTFEKKLIEKNISDVNAIIMVNYDNEISQIKFPKSHRDENLQIEYLGEIEYEY